MGKEIYRIGFSATWKNQFKQEMILFKDNGTINYLGKSITGKKGDRLFVRSENGKFKNSYKMKVGDQIIGTKGRYVYIFINNTLIGHAFDNVVWTGIERKSMANLYQLALQSGKVSQVTLTKIELLDTHILIQAKLRINADDIDTSIFTVTTKEELDRLNFDGITTLDFEYKFMFDKDENKLALISNIVETISWNGLKLK